MNTNLKRTIVGLALLFSMGMANAATTLINVNTKVPRGSFTDVYNFTISTLSAMAVTGSVRNLPPTGNNNFNISGLTLTLLNSSNAILAGPVGPLPSLIDSFVLTPGSYSFDVNGTGIGNKGGMYLVHVSALPIPEPATYAMMLAGLGLLGFTAYRRKSLDA